MFGPKRVEVTGGWRKPHNEEFRNLYSSRNIFMVIKSKRMRWEGTWRYGREEIYSYKRLVGKGEGKRPLERHRRRWEDNFKMYLKEIDRKDVNWMQLARVGSTGGKVKVKFSLCFN
jgi:hypothetical protein